MVVGVGVGVAAMGYGVRVGGVDGVSKKIASMRHFPSICVPANRFSGSSGIIIRIYIVYKLI